MTKHSKNLRLGHCIGHVLVMTFCLSCLLPFLLLISASLTEEHALIRNGYSFIPSVFSLESYKYLGVQIKQIIHAYGITIFITLVGTTASLVITSMMSWALSRRDLPHRAFFNFILFFTMLFNGGLVPTYIFYTKYLGIKNTIWALIIPSLLMNAFNVVIMRSYFANNIPYEIVEACKVDGASEMQIFRKVVIPLSSSIIATVCLLVGIAYWNDWFNGMTYVTESRLYSIQNLLNRIIQDAQYMNSMGAQSGVVVDTSQIPSTSVRMAIAVIGVLPILIIYPFFQRFFVKGIAIGAVKG